jgi:hypothetical protein
MLSALRHVFLRAERFDVDDDDEEVEEEEEKFQMRECHFKYLEKRYLLVKWFLKFFKNEEKQQQK